MGTMKSNLARRGRPRLRLLASLACLGAALLITALCSAREANADWPWKRWQGKPPCGHTGCHRDRCRAPEGWAGNWFWVRSPDQEKRVVMSLFNRYCIRCHGIDGRGVWDIPDVPDFTDVRWQQSRAEAQVVNIITEGRGAVMPAFRGTLSLDEVWAMAHYLRTFVPGTEVPRPDVGRAPAASPGGTEPANTQKPVTLPALPSPAGTSSPAR